MADIDVATMTGADLTGFREAMLRAGVPTLIGRFSSVDCNSLGDVATIPIIGVQAVQIVGFAIFLVSGAPTGIAMDLRSAAAGGGVLMYPELQFLAAAGHDGDTSFAAYNSTAADTRNVYVNVRTAGTWVFDLLLFGIYPDPA